MTETAYAPFVAEQERDNPMPGITVATLEERVKNHVQFFFWIIGGLAVWLAGLSAALYTMNGKLGQLTISQANATSSIVASLLNHHAPTPQEAAADLNAAATIMRNAKIGEQKPTTEALKSVSLAVEHARQQYSELPELWKATAQFIDYKSNAVLPRSVKATIAKARSLKCGSITTGPAIEFSGCSLDIESLKISTGEPIVFKDSVIRYSGGEIALKAPIVRFQNCIFEFDISSIPSPSGARFMEQLASTTSADQTIPFS